MAELPPNAEELFSFGDIAQLVEQMTFNHWVQGSNPCVSTKNKDTPLRCVFVFDIDADLNPKKGVDPQVRGRR